MVRRRWVSSLFDTSTLWRKSSVLTLFCTLDTTGFISLKGHLAFCERTFNVGWRAFVMDSELKSYPTQLCRHGIPSLYTQQLPLIFTACHWQLRTATSDFSVPMHVLGATPIKAPFDHHLILKRSAFWRWNYFWGAPILEYMLTIKKKNIAPAITDVMRVNTAMKTSNLQKKYKN